MTLLQLILLALIQGITEFLPISSSGHLILLPRLGSFPDQGQLFDVSVHVGTLFAVIIYFWSDVRCAIIGTPRMLMGKRDTRGEKLAFMLLVATVPVIILGFAINFMGWATALRSTAVIGWSMLGFGIFLWLADTRSPTEKTNTDWNIRDAWMMGLWQAVALIPGTSRSGITITAGRLLGYTRESSAHLAMLMSIPTITASGILLGAEAYTEISSVTLIYPLAGAVLSFIAALLALKFMMALLKSVSFTPYVIYRVILGSILLIIAYS